MKKRKTGATALWTLLALVLAGTSMTLGTPARAATTMAAFDAQPALAAQVDKPTALAVDTAGRVYVAESMNNKVRILSQGGVLLANLGGTAKPISVAVDAAGKIYVGSGVKGSVTVYGSDLAEQSKLGAGDGEFGEPVDIDIDAAGQVYVTDKARNTIGVYSAAGQKVKAIGTAGNGNGQFNHPVSLAIDPVAGELVVVDQQQVLDSYTRAMIDGARIQYFNMDGAFLRGYSKFGYGTGQLVKPQQVVVDGAGRVYVTDSRRQKVMVYDNANTFLGTIDNSAAPLRTSLGMAMSATGRLYVASLLAGRVDVFGIENYAAMGVSPASLAFTATEGGSAPAGQSATVRNSGKAEVNWSATATTKDGGSWLTVPAAGGTLAPAATGSVAVGVQAEGMAPGTYQGSVKIAAPGMEEVVAVTLTVTANPLNVSPNNIAISTTVGTTPAAETILINNSGAEPLSWSAAASQSWLALSKTSGGAPDSLKVYANPAGLAEGSYNGAITFTNNGGGKPVTVAVSLTIGASSAPPTDPPGLPLPGSGELSAGGKKWKVAKPAAGTALRGVWGSGSKDAIVVGDNGTILDFDGKTWKKVASGTESALQGVWGAATDTAYNVYAVGDGGTALHFNGTKWSKMAPVSSANLSDVSGVGSDVLAVGSNGIILNLNSGTADAAPFVLRSIWSGAADDVFAVGESGRVLHSDGTSWTEMISGSNQWLNAAWGSSGTDVFAVGENGSILHYDGSTWSPMNSGVTETLHGVYGDAPNNVYAVGDNAVLLHYDGTAWTVLIAGGVSLRDVWTGDGTVVVAGDDGTVLTGRATARKKGGDRPVLTPKSGSTPDATGKVVVSPANQGPLAK